jgi:hypothetical protein
MQPLPLRAAADIFAYLALEEHRDLALWVSCFEIYGGKLFDLLNSRQGLVMREDGKGRVCIVGLKEVRALFRLRFAFQTKPGLGGSAIGQSSGTWDGRGPRLYCGP